MEISLLVILLRTLPEGSEFNQTELMQITIADKLSFTNYTRFGFIVANYKAETTGDKKESKSDAEDHQVSMNMTIIFSDREGRENRSSSLTLFYEMISNECSSYLCCL